MDGADVILGAVVAWGCYSAVVVAVMRGFDEADRED